MNFGMILVCYVYTYMKYKIVIFCWVTSAYWLMTRDLLVFVFVIEVFKNNFINIFFLCSVFVIVWIILINLYYLCVFEVCFFVLYSLPIRPKSCKYHIRIRNRSELSIINIWISIHICTICINDRDELIIICT